MKKSYALFVAGLAMSLSATAVTKTADKTVSALEAQEMYSASQLSISNRVSNRPLKAAPMKAAGVENLVGGYEGFYDQIYENDPMKGRLYPYFMKGENAGELEITRLPYSDITMKANLSSDNTKLLIPAQNVVYRESDGKWLKFQAVECSVASDGSITMEKFLDNAEGVIMEDGTIEFPENVVFSYILDDTTLEDFRFMWVGKYVSIKRYDYLDFVESEWIPVGKGQFTDGWFQSQFFDGVQGFTTEDVDVLCNAKDNNLYAIVNPYKSDYWTELESYQNADGMPRDGYIVFSVENPNCVAVRPFVPCGYYIDMAQPSQTDPNPEPDPQMGYPYNVEGQLHWYDGQSFDEIVADYASAGAPLSTYNKATRTVEFINLYFGYEMSPLASVYWVNPENDRIDWMVSKFIMPDLSGINGVEMENADAPVKYYNMQGMEIANPAEGQLVIKKQGNNAVKVVM